MIFILAWINVRDSFFFPSLFLQAPSYLEQQLQQQQPQLQSYYNQWPSYPQENWMQDPSLMNVNYDYDYYGDNSYWAGKRDFS